jgi:hypothetical protein
MGSLDVQTVQCNSDNTCSINVPAPGFALVFFNDDVFGEVTPQTTETFSTSIATKTINTVTIDPSVLATSNGQSGATRKLGSTSPGSAQSGAVRLAVPSILGLIVMLIAGTIMTVFIS